jgi:hypothetical protein
MKPSRSSDTEAPRPSIVMALELIGIDEAHLSEELVRRALTTFVPTLGDAASGDPRERSIVFLGARALRVAPIKRGGTPLFKELLNALHLQVDLIGAGIHVRGAITLGDASVLPTHTVGRGITAARVFVSLGPGIGEAERLRDAVAEVPRVIVDPRLLAEAEQNPDLRAPHHRVEEELGYVHDVLRADADGVWFIDYLRAFRSEVDEPHLYVDFLAEHADLLRRRLASCTALDRESRRWTWLWRYHNRVIDALHRSELITGKDRSRLRITAAGPLFYTFPRSDEPE